MLKVWYTDFWKGWDPYNNWISKLLLKGIDFVIDPNPDLLIHSCYGKQHIKYKCKKISWIPENVRPNFNASDLVFGFDFLEHPNYMRFPLYALQYVILLYESGAEDQYATYLTRQKLKPQHQKFCAFVYGNATVGVNQWGNYQDGVEKRLRMFHSLNKIKEVDSVGSALNNQGVQVQGKQKIDYIRNCKFTFAIENSSYPGYVTEKIIEPMFAHSIPIYWGSPRIKEDFQGGYVDLHQMDEKDGIEYLIELDAKPALYEELYFQNYFNRDFNLIDYFKLSLYTNRIIELINESSNSNRKWRPYRLTISSIFNR